MNNGTYDYLIVGAGFAGSVIAERIATQLDKKVLIIDKRNHIAGNAYDEPDDEGILIHKYGPHIFHTSSKKVWDYLSQFTEWYPYIHTVLAVIDGKKIPVPFNFNSLELLFPTKYAFKLEKILLEKYGYGLKIPILKLMEVQDKSIKELAEYIYKNVFLGYTVKQWGLKPEELDFSVTSRVPVYISRDNRYFQDIYQGIPAKGYTAMFQKILAHRNITILLDTEFQDIMSNIRFNKLVFTGNIDQYFDYVYGSLPYRSLTFDFKTFNRDYFQEVAQVNYPNDNDYTRITEFKYFLNKKANNTTVAYEYPSDYTIGFNEPYYPIPKAENLEQYNKYIKFAEKYSKNVLFIGRLADYKYYNMDHIVGVALMTFEKWIAGWS